MSTTQTNPAKAPTAMKSPAGIRYSVEVVTPQLAESWLTKNTDNRNMRRATVDRYARDMEGGVWSENGSSVCFAIDGTLLDGQHRLAAVVASGAAVPMLIVRDLPNLAQDTMDDLAKRTAADTFKFHGIGNWNTAAAITRRVLMWENGDRTNSGNSAPTKSEMLDAWRTDPVLRTSVEAAMGMGSRAIVPASVIGLTYWLFAQIDADDAATFWSGLHSGSDLTAGSPILVVREKIQRANAVPGRRRESEYLAWIIKAWNLWRRGKTVAPEYRGFNMRPGERMPEPR